MIFGKKIPKICEIFNQINSINALIFSDKSPIEPIMSDVYNAQINLNIKKIIRNPTVIAKIDLDGFGVFFFI